MVIWDTVFTVIFCHLANQAVYERHLPVPPNADGYSSESLGCALADGIFHVVCTVTWQTLLTCEDSTPDLRHQKLSRHSWTTPNGQTGVSPPENTQSMRHFLLTDHRMHNTSSRSKKIKACLAEVPVCCTHSIIWYWFVQHILECTFWCFTAWECLYKISNCENFI